MGGTLTGVACVGGGSAFLWERGTRGTRGTQSEARATGLLPHSHPPGIALQCACTALSFHVALLALFCFLLEGHLGDVRAFRLWPGPRASRLLPTSSAVVCTSHATRGNPRPMTLRFLKPEGHAVASLAATHRLCCVHEFCTFRVKVCHLAWCLIFTKYLIV